MPALIKRQNIQTYPFCTAELMQGAKHRVVIQCCRQNMRGIRLFRKKSGDQRVQCIRRILGKDHLIRSVRSQKPGNAFAGKRCIIYALRTACSAGTKRGQLVAALFR